MTRKGRSHSADCRDRKTAGSVHIVMPEVLPIQTAEVLRGVQQMRLEKKSLCILVLCSMIMPLWMCVNTCFRWRTTPQSGAGCDGTCVMFFSHASRQRLSLAQISYLPVGFPGELVPCGSFLAVVLWDGCGEFSPKSKDGKR